MPCCLHHHGLSRRQFLAGVGVAGAGGLLLPGAASAALFPAGELSRDLAETFRQAGGATLGEIQPLRLTGKDLPWTVSPLNVSQGQEVTFILGGRWFIARAADLWFEPGMVFHARVDGGPMYCPMNNTGTMTAKSSGPLTIARSAGEWANADGELLTPTEAYLAADGEIEGVAIAWKGSAEDGLKRMLALGDVGGLLGQELVRLQNPAVTPQGWHNHFNFGEAGIFTLYDTAKGPEIACNTHKNVSIMQHDVSAPLDDDLSLNWQWLVDELPSQLPEDSVLTHDYLSIAVEFDDGQDITYLWSAGIEAGTVFRCPLPGWDAIETHVVQRSGPEEFGRWLGESRQISQDYRDIIGGDATKVVRVWLLGVSAFQRRSGSCRYRGISLAGGGREQLVL